MKSPKLPLSYKICTVLHISRHILVNGDAITFFFDRDDIFLLYCTYQRISTHVSYVVSDGKVFFFIQTIFTAHRPFVEGLHVTQQNERSNSLGSFTNSTKRAIVLYLNQIPFWINMTNLYNNNIISTNKHLLLKGINTVFLPITFNHIFNNSILKNRKMTSFWMNCYNSFFIRNNNTYMIWWIWYIPSWTFFLCLQIFGIF